MTVKGMAGGSEATVAARPGSPPLSLPSSEADLQADTHRKRRNMGKRILTAQKYDLVA
jgi:hypothetical protein